MRFQGFRQDSGIPERFLGFQKDSRDSNRIPIRFQDSRDSEKIPGFRKDCRDSNKILGFQQDSGKIPVIVYEISLLPLGVRFGVGRRKPILFSVVCRRGLAMRIIWRLAS